MTAYFISGLGADERIFERVVLSKDIAVKHVHWIEPLPGEPLQEYCRRLLPQINTNDDFVLIGLSFGGMVAIELNKIIHPKKIIIISTVATANEFPLQFKIARLLRFPKTLPSWLLKTPNPITNWFFGVRTKEEKEMLRYFLKTVTPNYLKWSMKTVLNWKNHERPSNLFHIHGKEDKIFPFEKTHADAIVENTGHFMVYDKAEEVSRILTRIINT